MINPSIDYLVTLVDSKYTLVVLAAKRGRELLNDNSSEIKCPSNKPVSIALYEIAQGKITYERTKLGIK